MFDTVSTDIIVTFAPLLEPHVLCTPEGDHSRVFSINLGAGHQLLTVISTVSCVTIVSYSQFVEHVFSMGKIKPTHLSLTKIYNTRHSVLRLHQMYSVPMVDLTNAISDYCYCIKLANIN